MSLITEGQLAAMIPTNKEVGEWCAALNEMLPKYGITTDKRIAGFIAQCAHESMDFRVLQENLNYSADGMAGIWPKRFAVMGPDKKPVKKDGTNQPNKFALALHRKPEMIANVVYSGRMGNGPTESGEGWLYRGRGLKQLTGKDNHRACSAGLGVDLVANPDLLLEPIYAARSAAWFWSTNNCNKFADAGDIEGLTKKINGGLIGIEDRKNRYNACIQSFAGA
jgi:putative chitinase